MAQKVRQIRNLEQISLEVQGGETWYFDVHNVLGYSLKGGDLIVVLDGPYELPAAKDELEVEQFLEAMDKIR